MLRREGKRLEEEGKTGAALGPFSLFNQNNSDFPPFVTPTSLQNFL